MRHTLLLVLLLAAWQASAQVYRWVDAHGTVNYSNAVPPAAMQATTLAINAQPGPPGAEQPIVRPELAQAEPGAERAMPSPPPVRGLDFRKYVSLARGMSEGELLAIAGEPDLRRRERAVRTYTYMPTPGDPFITTITLVRGRISEIERVRKF
ncbi:MAG TPA: DUF4124 domain-containing protein [Burkholderiales bacterium]|nr:DUF4124 domain-containing protein [Burkholderiales bacterium]